jgi:hypothetical protein
MAQALADELVRIVEAAAAELGALGDAKAAATRGSHA